MAKVDPNELESAGAEILAQEAVEKAREIQEKKARFAQILSRGYVNDRLAVANNLPDNRVGMWIRDRPEDIERHLALGGRVETREDAKADGLHGTGDNRVRVGDVILASMDREDFDIIQQVREEQKAARRNRGERAYTDAASKVSGVPVINENKHN